MAQLIKYSAPIWMKDYYDYVFNLINTLEFQNNYFLDHNHNHKERLEEALSKGYKKIFVNVEDSPISVELLNSSSCIIEYSFCNFIKHSQKLSHYKEQANKFVYIAPAIGDTDIKNLNNCSRENTYDIVTSLYNTKNIRRKNLIASLNSLKKYKYINVIGSWGEQIYKNYYSKSKVLLNAHAHGNRALEEIRVLPAILNQAIVISENSEYSEYLPYKKYIIWTDYNNIVNTVLDVLQDYKNYFNKMYSQTSEIYALTQSLKNKSILNLKEQLT